VYSLIVPSAVICLASPATRVFKNPCYIDDWPHTRSSSGMASNRILRTTKTFPACTTA